MSTSASTETTLVVKSNNKRKFIVMDKDDNVEYVVKFKHTKRGNKVYKLFYSKGEMWRDSVKGELRIKMTDTGNEMLFDFADKIDLSDLNYGELEELRIILKVERKISGDWSYKTVEVKK